MQDKIYEHSFNCTNEINCITELTRNKGKPLDSRNEEETENQSCNLVSGGCGCPEKEVSTFRGRVEGDGGVRGPWLTSPHEYN